MQENGQPENDLLTVDHPEALPAELLVLVTKESR
jgi:hypothetical protein